MTTKVKIAIIATIAYVAAVGALTYNSISQRAAYSPRRSVDSDAITVDYSPRRSVDPDAITVDYSEYFASMQRYGRELRDRRRDFLASNSRSSEDSAFAQKINEYPVENTPGECPVCLESDKKDIIKPFDCIHGICKECLIKWNEERSKQRTYDINFISRQCEADCPQCRANLKEV